MQVFDMHHGITVLMGKENVVASGVVDGEIIDTAGYESLEFIFQAGATVTVAPTLTLEHGDESDLSDATEVDAEEVLGTLVQVEAADDVGKVGYIGKERYVRVAQSAGNAIYGIVAVLGTAHHQPTDD